MTFRDEHDAKRPTLTPVVEPPQQAREAAPTLYHPPTRSLNPVVILVGLLIVSALAFSLFAVLSGGL